MLERALHIMHGEPERLAVRGRFDDSASARARDSLASAYASNPPCRSRCSGCRLVKTSASSSTPLWRYWSTPSLVISMTACVQWASTARRKKCWRKKRPGIVILKRLRSHCAPTQKRMVLAEATCLPLARKSSATSSTTDDLPLVPVTAITTSLREGK